MKLPSFSFLKSKDARFYIVIVLTLFFVFSFGIFARARVFAQTQLYATGQGIELLARFLFSSKGELAEENDRLREALLEQESLRSQNVLLEQENQELRNSLVTTTESPDLFDGAISAEIVRRVASRDRFLLEINYGSTDGATVGQNVLSAEGVFIGMIDSVTPSLSTVRLAQDIRSSIPVTVLNTRGTSGLLEGNSGYSLSLAFVPREADLSDGLTVVTSGVEGRYVQGLPIGTVSEIFIDDADPFKTALVSPLVNARDLMTVLILP